MCVSGALCCVCAKGGGQTVLGDGKGCTLLSDGKARVGIVEVRQLLLLALAGAREVAGTGGRRARPPKAHCFSATGVKKKRRASDCAERTSSNNGLAPETKDTPLLDRDMCVVTCVCGTDPLLLVDEQAVQDPPEQVVHAVPAEGARAHLARDRLHGHAPLGRHVQLCRVGRQPDRHLQALRRALLYHLRRQDRQRAHRPRNHPQIRFVFLFHIPPPCCATVCSHFCLQCTSWTSTLVR